MVAFIAAPIEGAPEVAERLIEMKSQKQSLKDMTHAISFVRPYRLWARVALDDSVQGIHLLSKSKSWALIL